MTRIAIKAFHPDTGRVHDMDPKDLVEYSEWIVRAGNNGYKPCDIGCGVVRFVSNHPGQTIVFTAKVIENARCALDYTDWTRGN